MHDMNNRQFKPNETHVSVVQERSEWLKKQYLKKSLWDPYPQNGKFLNIVFVEPSLIIFAFYLHTNWSVEKKHQLNIIIVEYPLFAPASCQWWSLLGSNSGGWEENVLLCLGFWGWRRSGVKTVTYSVKHRKYKSWRKKPDNGKYGQFGRPGYIKISWSKLDAKLLTS